LHRFVLSDSSVFTSQTRSFIRASRILFGAGSPWRKQLTVSR
jgi:hypothetical protein